MVMREGMVLVGIGGAIGAALAAVAGQALSGALYVGAFDVLSFTMAFAVLAIAAALANVVPAWRASRVDPMVALRHDSRCTRDRVVIVSRPSARHTDTAYLRRIGRP
jgi:ABC-type antimicrobial peptide transport system permease subunit